MDLRIKIPQTNPPLPSEISERLPYATLVEYSKLFKSKDELEKEMKTVQALLQDVEKEQICASSLESKLTARIKYTRITQLFKTLLFVKGSWPSTHGLPPF